MGQAQVRQPLSRKLPAIPDSVTEARHSIEEYARDLGVADADAVALAVSEADGNAVVHAYRARDPGEIELRAEALIPDTLVVTVIDDGDGMSPHPTPMGLGLGIPLLGALTVGLEIDAHPPHGTQVSMRFSLA